MPLTNKFYMLKPYFLCIETIDFMSSTNNFNVLNT